MPKAQRVLAAFTATALLVTVIASACSSDPSPEPTATSPALAAIASIAPTIYITPTRPQPPTATAIPTPAPTPTPDATALTEEARRAAFVGDDNRAIQLFSQALSLLDVNSETAQRTKLESGQSQFNAGDADAAIKTYASIVGAHGPAPLQHDARILLGRAHAANGDNANAILNYSTALTTSDILSPYLNLWIGDAYLAASQPISAIAPLQLAIEGASSNSSEFARREKLALAYQLTGDYAKALEQYDLILSRAQFPAYHARMLWESAQALLAAEKTQLAYQRLRDLVNNYPKTSQALLALQALISANQPVDELQRGIVDYHNGQHEAAREAFRRAILLNDGRENDVRYWAAQNYLKLGSPADAIRNLDQTIALNARGSPRIAEALAEKAKIYADLDDITNAKATFQQLIANAPASKTGASQMFDVGLTLARNKQLLAEAAQAFSAAEALQFSEELGPTALARAGALQFQLGNPHEAISVTQTAMDKYANSPQNLLAQLWLGKAQIAAGDIVSGQATLQSLAGRAPDDYEGTRAAELAGDPTRLPLTFPAPTAPLSTTTEGGGGEREQDEAEKWLRSWLNLTDTVDVRSLRDDIRNDRRFQRGSELWRLGFKPEARDEFEALRAAYTNDALAQYQLALFFRDIGLYRSSIGAADTLMRLSPTKTPSALPTFIAKLLYPNYYADLVQQYAKEFDLDPLLVFALIRQESLFEPFAASSAAAQGLMQIVPPTGREINSDLNWPPNYTTSDLYRPYVNTRFGTYYLAKQRSLLKELYAALAAYNGGPGNSLRWKERSALNTGANDPDLFYLTIPFEETQRYIRTVGANYAIYHRLYGKR